MAFPCVVSRYSILAFLYLTAFFCKANGLICFWCDNEKSFDMCTRMGSLRFCQPNENSCHTEVLRFSRPEGVVFSISKRCKQDDACQNNQIQNPKAAWQPSQCNPRFPNSVCRCCCKGDLCNRGGLYCPLGPLCSKIPEIKQNGYTKCDLGRNRYSVCSHECMDGFTLFGPEATECVVRGSLRWSNNTVPKCLRTTCTWEKVQIRNGITTCTDRNNLGSQCGFDCVPGYALQLGWPVATCAITNAGEDPQWDGELPVCSRITCRDVPKRQNGIVECSNTTQLDSLCRLTCNREEGYYPIGAKAVKCDIKYNRLPPVWSEELGKCRKIVCPALDPLENGDIRCSAEYQFTSQCRYICKKGYRRVGPSMRKCRSLDEDDNGKWHTMAPIKCQPELCLPDISAPANGKKECTDANRFKSMCSFTCSSGFYRRGPPETTCLYPHKKGSRAWSHQVPSCSVITCAIIPREPNRRTTCTNKIAHGSKCSFTCNKGYSMQGASSVVCVGDGSTRTGEWDDTPPSCVPDSCPLLARPENGKKICTNGRTYGSRCVFECDEGYVLNGPDSSECHAIKKSTPEWSSSMPSCDMIVCRSQPLSDNMKMECTNGVKYGSTCAYECDKGYKMSGSQTRSCADQDGDGVGKWTAPQPTCERITCFTPKLPENLKMKCTDGSKQSSVCTFSCSGDFELKGPISRVCADEDGDGVGKWTDALPTCTKVPCSPYKGIANGNVECTDGSNIRSECSYRCDKGYKMIGSGERICLDSDKDGDGEWSGPPPTCKRIVCFVPELPGRLKMRCTDANNYGSTCTFTCSDDYVLRGPNSRDCVDANRDGVGEWTDVLPRCLRVPCSPYKQITNGAVKCTDESNIGSKCTYECDTGYRRIGSEQRSCLDTDVDGNGEWSAPPASCKRIVCILPKLPAVLNMECNDESNYGSVCKFFCSGDYELGGPKSRKCVDADGNGVGEWTDVLPNCKQVPCSPYKSIVNGDVECSDGSDIRSKCLYTCNEGYRLTGSEQRSCLDTDRDGDGEWSTSPPKCERIVCSVPKIPKVMQMKCTDESNYGSVCTFSCIGNHELKGPQSRKCADVAGVGKWTDTLPTCTKVPCPPYKPIANGKVRCTDGSNLQSACTYTCDPGYELKGTDYRFCLDSDGDGDGEWTDSPPTCELAVCPEEVLPDNLNEKCTDGVRFGSICSYECDAGHNILGSIRRSCSDPNGDGVGSWSSSLPSCTIVVCRLPKVPAVMNMECSDGANFGSTCVFSCNGGYQLNPRRPESRECIDRYGRGVGQWSDAFPTCIKTPCNQYKDLENGVVTCTAGSNIRSVCSYKCDPGYKLSGSFRRVCLDTDDDGVGKWTVPPPTCEVINCPELQHEEKVSRKCTKGTAFSSKCNFACPDDHVLFPFYSQRIECLANGTWSDDPPCCFEYCPPKAVMDMVVILDSSSSITAANWIKVIDFVKSVISVFTISRDFARFGFFRYNKWVDTDNEVHLKDFTTNQQFVDALDDLPYNGEGTYTGRALDHALRYSFRPDNGNRPGVTDIILLITDGVSTGVDDIIEESVAKLRKSNVEVIALFIQPVTTAFTGRALAQLTEITGNRNNIIQPKAGFESLNEVLAPVSEVACKRKCQGRDVVLTSKEEFELLVQSGAYDV